MLRTPLVSTLLIVACTGSPDGASEVARDHAADVAALRSTAESYHAAAGAKDVDGVLAHYDGDALMVPPSGDLVEGLAAVHNYRFGFIETPGVSLVFDLIRAEVSPDGQMGWTLAIGDITIDRGDDPPGKEIVRDFHAWKRQPDGSWKVTVDMWNSGPTP